MPWRNKVRRRGEAGVGRGHLSGMFGDVPEGNTGAVHLGKRRKWSMEASENDASFKGKSRGKVPEAEMSFRGLGRREEASMVGAEWAKAKGRGEIREGAGGVSCGTLWAVTRTLGLSSRVTQSC